MFKSKRIVALLLMIALVFSAGIIVVQAGNTSDTSFSFGFYTGTNPTADTATRNKDDSSGSYMKCNSVNPTTASYTAKVFGVSSSGTKYDCALASYTFKSGTIVQSMKNNVRASGYTKACIRAYASFPSGVPGYSASGVWSPDNSTGI